MTGQEKLMRAYLEALAAKDPATVIALFDAAGVVESPLSGRPSAAFGEVLPTGAHRTSIRAAALGPPRPPTP